MVRFNIECPVAFTREQFWRVRDCATFLKFIVDDGLLKSISITDPVLDEDGSGTLSRQQFYCPLRVECPEFIRHVVGDTMFNVSDHQRWNDEVRPYCISFEIRPAFLTDLSTTSGELSIEPFPLHKQPKTHHSKSNTNTQSDEDSNTASTTSTASSDTSSSSEEEEDDDVSQKKKQQQQHHRQQEDKDKDMTPFIDRLDPDEKCIHRVVGHIRVRILTLGWFVERSVAHNLRLFYKGYANTIYRFRAKLYRDFANDDYSVPIDVVIDRLLQHEATQQQQQQQHDEDFCSTNAAANETDNNSRCVGPPTQTHEFLSPELETVPVPAAR